MTYRIRSNVMSLKTLRQVEGRQENLVKSTTRLASGKRINSAADDAAGLAISENLRAKTRSLNMAVRNSVDAMSVFQIAEGGFHETTNMLVRLRQLAVQASSDTIGNIERNHLDQEFVQLKHEIDRIAATVEFNGVRLLTGQPEPPQSSIREVASKPVDYPMEFQVDAHYYSGVDGRLAENPLDIIRFSSKHLVAFTEGRDSLNIGETRVHSKKAAQLSIMQLGDALEKVAEHRSVLGAAQNRMEAVLQVLGTRIENSSMSGSRIVDADFAKETADYVKNNVLRSAGTAVLSVANAAPGQALSLLANRDPKINIIKQSIISKSL